MFLSEDNGFHLSDTVLVAIISGASANITGLMAIATRYLFPPKKQPPPRAPQSS